MNTNESTLADASEPLGQAPAQDPTLDVQANDLLPESTIALDGAFAPANDDGTVMVGDGDQSPTEQLSAQNQDCTVALDEEPAPVQDGCTVDLQAGSRDAQDGTLALSGEGGKEDATLSPPGGKTFAPTPDGTVALDREALTHGDAEPADSTHHTVDLPADQSGKTHDGALNKTFGSPEDDRTGFLQSFEGKKAAGTVQPVDKTVKPAVGPALAPTPQRKAKKEKFDPGAKKVVAGYEILGELGRGGMGVVYKAKQPGTNRLVALKMVLGGGHASKEQLGRFKIEAEAVAELQHPNIVQLYETGEDDGNPFFSLEFVEGQPLNAKIESEPQAPAHAADLVRQMAQGMHLAHSRGIIHRDLKPANILLTTDGVPKITDFGLAKRFEDEGHGQTRSGAIMGTPSYMAPEQAQGRTKHTGPAADIYSLGAILYDLLTGRPPFRGTTLLETLQQVQNLEPVPPVRLQPSVPKDLQTICLKCLQKDAKKRYLTAGDLAEDLRRFMANEPITARPTPWYERTWKWMKRNPARASLVGVCVVGVVSLLTLGGLWLDSERRSAEDREQQQANLVKLEKATADKEKELRQNAEKNFQRAKSAVDKMLSQLGQDQLKYIPKMGAVRSQLLNEARNFYREFKEERSNDPATLLDYARAQQRFADIEEQLGKHRDAEAAYQDALNILQQLAERDPTRAEYRQALANSAGNLGNLLKDLKRNRDAEDRYRLALKVRQDLYAKEPSLDHGLELCKTRNNLAVLLQLMGQAKQAQPLLEESRDLLRDVVNQENRSDGQIELARTLENLGTLHKSLGNLALAEKSYQEATALLDGKGIVLAADQGKADMKMDLARNHALLADLLRDSKPAQAEHHYQEAIRLRTKLAKDFPEAPTYQQELARSLAGLAVLHQAAGQPKLADDNYSKALQIQENLVNNYPHLPDFRRHLASSCNNRGLMLLQGGRPIEAHKVLFQARDLFAALSLEFTDVPDFAAELAGTYLNLGTLAHAQNNGKEALASYQKSLDLRQELAKRFQHLPEHRQELGRAFLNLATLLQIQQQSGPARENYRQAVAVFDHLYKDDGKNPEYAYELALAERNLGNLLRGDQDPAPAEESWNRARILLRTLVKDQPNVPAYAQELGRLDNELGILLASTRRLPAADQAWTEGLEQQRGLFQKDQANNDYRLDLARSLGNYGALLLQRNQPEKGEVSYREGLALLEPVVEKGQAPTAFLEELAAIHTNLGALMEAVKKPAQAEKSWLRKLDLQEQLVTRAPNNLDYRLKTVQTLNDLGHRLLGADKFDQARVFYEQAVDHLGQALKQSQGNKTLAGDLYVMQLNLATAQVGSKDHAAAAAVIEECSVKSRPPMPHDHLAAALLGRCANLARKDPKLTDQRKEETTKTYGDRAMTLLETAVKTGFRDAKLLQAAEDFQELRSRNDFRALVRRLEGKK